MQANNVLREVKNMNLSIRHRIPPHEIGTAIYSFLDSTFRILKPKPYDQLESMKKLLFLSHFADAPVHHPILWSSTKKIRLSHTSHGAQIFACTNADVKRLSLNSAVTSMYPSDLKKYCVYDDWKDLWYNYNSSRQWVLAYPPDCQKNRKYIWIRRSRQLFIDTSNW